MRIRKAAFVGTGRVTNALHSHWVAKTHTIQRFLMVTPRLNLLTIHIHAPKMAVMKAQVVSDAGQVLHAVEGQGSVGFLRVSLTRQKQYTLTCELLCGITEGGFEVQVYSDGILKLSRC